MSISVFIIIVLTLTLLFLSIRERVQLSLYRDKEWDVIGESKASPLSRAITNLIGTAGGIYLSMVLLFTFLEVNVPDRVNMGDVSLEPLAALAIILAIGQPFVLKLFQLRKRF